MRIYKAAVHDPSNRKKTIFIESEYPTKAEFIKELRSNGYLVDPSKVKTKIEFNRIIKETNADEWDWKPRKYKHINMLLKTKKSNPNKKY